MENLNYKIIRSSRKTIAIQVTPDGVTVKAPLHAGDKEIERFVISRKSWIEKSLEKVKLMEQNSRNTPKMTQSQLEELAKEAAKYIPGRVRHFAPLVGVAYGRVTIRCQKTRWGSCSEKGNLNFNCLLMLAPPEVIDSVVVHELCHRKQMNHSAAFYGEVYRVFPEYDKCSAWLKAHGAELMDRVF